MSDAKTLNTKLATASYLTGFQPSQDDVTAFSALSAADVEAFPNTKRWFNHIASFSAAERAAFPGAAGGKGGDAKAPAAAAADESEEESDDPFASGSDSDDEETKAMMAAKADQIKAIQARQTERKKSSKSNLTLDVKPESSEVDMDELIAYVKGSKFEGVTWLGHQLIDVAYGLKKLRIMCQIVDQVAPAPDTIREELEKNEDLIQSTDVFAFQMA